MFYPAQMPDGVTRKFVIDTDTDWKKYHEASKEDEVPKIAQHSVGPTWSLKKIRGEKWVRLFSDKKPIEYYFESK